MLPIKHQFHLPKDMIYLDGNSLGPLPVAALKQTAAVIQDQWGEHLITGWNRDGWMQQPGSLGNALAPIIGASNDTIMVGDTLSIKVFQAVSAALSLRPDRRVVLSDSGNFPTDLYMAEGLMSHINGDYELKIVDPEEVRDAIDESVAVVMLTHIDYRTGRMHDMQNITAAAHQAGAVMLWDLAHSAGAVVVDVEACGCEFAVGCTYKYLNAGPGAPAFIYARPDIADQVQPILSGWLGHDAPFAFEPQYRPGQQMERFRVGTPPVIQMAVLESALAVWQGISMHDVRQRSVELSELFIQLVEQRCPSLELVSPRNSAERGSQVSFAFENGYAAMQALIDRKVIGDFRQPNLMRFGFTPLYTDEHDVTQAVDVLADVIENRLWDNPIYLTVKAVT